MIKFIKKIFNRNKKFENLKKAIAEANKSFWKQKAFEMFVEFKDEGYTICGKSCLKQEAIESFEKYSGYTLNELGVKQENESLADTAGKMWLLLKEKGLV